MATLTLTLDDQTMALLERYAAEAAANPRSRSPKTAEGQALRFLALGLGKNESTTRHAGKVKRAKQDPTSGEVFKRYTPTLPAHVFTAPETEPKVAEWAEEAPSRGVRRVDVNGEGV